MSAPAGLDAPLSFTPVYQSTVWGGRRLEQWRDDLPEGPIGESWDISDQARGMSVVAEGPLAGTSLADLVRDHAADLLGPGFDGTDGFPLLIKVIDANDRLSVQVHPDDGLAQELGVGRRGKTECWYLIGDGGELYQGTRAGVDAAGFRQAIEQDRVAECVQRFATNDGDFFFMPARTVHALGTGCLLFEIQQSCDVTFRVYDWGRVGLDGKPRQLHIEESLRTIDFSSAQAGPERTVLEPLEDGGSRRALVTCPYFAVEERRGSRIGGPACEHCAIVCVVAGAGTLATAGGSCRLAPMHSYLVPAAAGAWTAEAADGQELRILISHPRP